MLHLNGVEVQAEPVPVPENMNGGGATQLPPLPEGSDIYITCDCECDSSNAGGTQSSHKPEVEADESLAVFHGHVITVDAEAYENPEKHLALGGFDAGIPDDEALQPFPPPLHPARKFSRRVLEEGNKTNIRLLLLAAALTLVFGIKEQGLGEGWFDGIFVFTVTIVLVLATSVNKMKNNDGSNPDTKSELQVQIDNLNGRIQNISLMVSILTLIVLFLRYMAGKVDEEKGYRPEPKDEPTSIEIIQNSLGKIVSESTCIAKAKKVLFVSLVGVTEGVPFVISLAIRHQSHHHRSTNTTDPHPVANLTRICTSKSGDSTENEKVDSGDLVMFPAPREADTKTNSSKKAKENSEIIIIDGSSEDLIFENIQSFLQLFLITTNSCTFITLIEIAAFGNSPLTGVQLTWLNLATPFLGGFALLTKPIRLISVGSRSSLITTDMIRNILFQVLYQTICILVLGQGVVNVLGTNEKEMQSMASNSFTLCQIFNLFNARELKNKNFFKCIHQHIQFWVAGVIFIGLQVTFVQASIGYGARLNWKQWMGCILISALSWLVDWLGKCISSDCLGKSTSLTNICN